MDKKTLIEWDKNYIWHPFTQMKYWLEEEPVIITEGRDCFIKDIDGKWYLDGVSSLWVNIHETTKYVQNLKVESFDGLLVDFIKQKEAVAIIRGLRAVSDYEFELQLAHEHLHLMLQQSYKAVSFLLPELPWNYIFFPLISLLKK